VTPKNGEIPWLVKTRLAAIAFLKGIAAFGAAFLILQALRLGFPQYFGTPFPGKLYGILYVAAAGGAMGYIKQSFSRSVERISQSSSSLP
jgi:hypothetical protein